MVPFELVASSYQWEVEEKDEGGGRGVGKELLSGFTCW